VATFELSLTALRVPFHQVFDIGSKCTRVAYPVLV